MEITNGALSLAATPARSWLTLRSHWLGYFGLFLLLSFSWIPNSYSAMVGWPCILIWQVAFLLLSLCTIGSLRKFSTPFFALGYGLDWIVAAMLAVTLFSVANADFTAVAVWNFLLFGNYIVALYLLVHLLRSGLSRTFLWFSTVVSGTVTTVVGLWLWQPNPDMWLSDNFHSALRNSSPLGHHNFVGGYNLLIFPISLSLCVTQKGWKRWVCILFSGVIGVGLYVSGSRGAMVGALMLLLLGMPFQLWQHRRKVQKSYLVGGVLILLTALALAFSNPRMSELFEFSTSPEVDETASVVVADGPTADRLFMLQAARNIFLEHPIVGVGPGNLSRVYSLYRPIEAGGGMALIQQLHNTPAQILAELGALGFGVYIGWLVWLIRMTGRIYSKVTDSTDRYLLYGIAASFVGYGFSSLTDYQLENIGISSSLLILTALLVRLGDAYIQKPDLSIELSRRSRRIISLSVFVFIGINVQAWARFDTGLYLSLAAANDVKNGNVVSADAKWSRASDVVGWDPTYAVLAAERLVKLRKGAANQKDKDILTASAIEYLESAIRSAPNDPWFNQNIATLLIQNGRAEAAESYAERAVSLIPRSRNYTYYTLGLSYLDQGKTNQATSAFSLEALSNPKFLTTNIWMSEPFSELLPSVLDQTIHSYRRILAQTNPLSDHFSWLNEQLALLSWWYQRLIEGVDVTSLSPIVQILIEIDSNPEIAANTIQTYVDQAPDDSSLQLIQAWLLPDQYLSNYLKDFEGTQQEKDQVIQNINKHRDIRSWMNSVQRVVPPQERHMVGFAYRNLYANQIKQSLYPGALQTSFFLDPLELYQEPPRTFPQLDREIDRLNTERRSLS
ncbi:O-Antigen Polymerase family [Synechococcus sp. PCC 7335]|uniref:O-antigen ligase family protein n=1 Tax=Synechococcus sp. (strain ATCC 29403 / PCC 7335) TaxID=91464 RepID=UPI00017EC790|nr:O-antigen ligase family protein [Synechococcus sp. PCC 7335]EDX85831.1 O-Antigen Polymerase family [Synechococcus sp. PCC 7335]